jgi:hypothetical protein
MKEKVNKKEIRVKIKSGGRIVEIIRKKSKSKKRRYLRKKWKGIKLRRRK